MSAKPWTVFKFGGTSVGTAQRIAGVADLVCQAHKEGPLAVVLSAVGGVTNTLVELTRLAAARDPALDCHLTELHNKHRAITDTLLHGEFCRAAEERIAEELSNLQGILRAVSLERECSRRIYDYATGLGEVMSATIVSQLLTQRGLRVGFVDAREVLVVEPTQPNPTILWDESQTLLRSQVKDDIDLVVITGFVCKTQQDIPATLGRNGSDFSAAIFGYLFDALEIVIWTDVDGVMSADPRLVSEALVVPELSYREAIELAHFGAKVIHPGTMVPAVAKGIPIRIKNTFRPHEPGSLIHSGSHADPFFPVKGCTTMNAVAIINVEATGAQTLAGLAARVFPALCDASIPLLMASVGAPGNCISLALPRESGLRGKKAIEEVFASEGATNQVLSVSLSEDHALLAVVGEGMTGRMGSAARFCNALAKADVNINAMVQGGLESTIGVVIPAASATRALRATHAGYYLSPQTLSIGIIGTGRLGSTLLRELNRMAPQLLRDHAIDVRVRGLINTKSMLLEERSIDLNAWENALNSAATRPHIAEFISHILTPAMPHGLLVDCTASEDIARHYVEWLTQGLHIITPNKLANAMEIDLYHTLQKEMRQHKRHYLYETTVCAGLPIIETLADLIQTGDTIHGIEGIVSGGIATLIAALEQGCSAESAWKDIVDRRLWESCLENEFNGSDAARTLVVLARESGLDLDLHDVEVVPLLPDGVSVTPRALEAVLIPAIEQARQRDQVVRYTIQLGGAHKPRVALRQRDADHPFARVSGGDNAVQFHTERYQSRPLLVQGPGAGADVAVAGILADFLRLTRYLGSMG